MLYGLAACHDPEDYVAMCLCDMFSACHNCTSMSLMLSPTLTDMLGLRMTHARDYGDGGPFELENDEITQPMHMFYPTSEQEYLERLQTAFFPGSFGFVWHGGVSARGLPRTSWADVLLRRFVRLAMEKICVRLSSDQRR